MENFIIVVMFLVSNFISGVIDNFMDFSEKKFAFTYNKRYKKWVNKILYVYKYFSYFSHKLGFYFAYLFINKDNGKTDEN